MALGFGAKGEEDVIALISKKNYGKAIEVLKKGKAVSEEEAEEKEKEKEKEK